MASVVSRSETMIKAEKWLKKLRADKNLDDDIRGAKAIEVGLRLCVAICTSSLCEKGQTDGQIGKAVGKAHDAIARYRVSSQTPEPEIVIGLYREYEKATGVFARAKDIRTAIDGEE